MRPVHSAVTLALIVTLLASCGGADAYTGADVRKGSGRYSGIGVFDAGRLWAQMRGAPKPADDASATLADDEHVIVVLDSQTGEVRQCGDHSGYCVSMKPWAGGADAVKLEKHAADLDVADTAVDTTVVDTAQRPAG
jgi:hypothetical protein